MKRPKQITWTTEQAAREFGRSRTTVAARLADAGTKPDGDGKFTTQQICAALFGSAHSARIREATARAELAEARTAILHRRWLPAVMVESAWCGIVTTIRQRLLEVPSTVAGSDAKLSERIRKEISTTLEDLSKAELPKDFSETETEKMDNENDTEK
jgi:hypothetical protein